MAKATDLTKQGVALHAAGDIANARRLFVQAVQVDPRYEMAWLWLSSVVSNPPEKRYCLEQALKANPSSSSANRGLQSLPASLKPTPPPELNVLSVSESETVPTPQVMSLEKITLNDASDTRKCPFCAELIKAEANVCRYCGRDIPQNTAATMILQHKKDFFCSNCGKYVHADATQCWNCKKIFHGHSGAVSRPVAGKKQSSLKSLRNIIIFSLVIFGILSYIGNSVGPGNSSPSKPYSPKTTDAVYMCQQFVKDRLKSPDNVEFDTYQSSISTALGNNTFNVIAGVLAQNSFGVRIHSKFSCRVSYASSTDKWTLLSLSFDE